MVVNQKNSGTHEDGGTYSSVINEIANKNICPFCPGELYLKHHKEPIIKEGRYWLFTKNSYPYKEAQLHLMFILKRHETKVENLDPEELGEIAAMLKEYLPAHNINHGSLFIRSGDTRYNSSSVEHLHAQYVSKNPELPDQMRVGL
jgi:diadenosine tetraphosphate (Ap4A) HIT family hydrolase